MQTEQIQSHGEVIPDKEEVQKPVKDHQKFENKSKAKIERMKKLKKKKCKTSLQTQCIIHKSINLK